MVDQVCKTRTLTPSPLAAIFDLFCKTGTLSPSPRESGNNNSNYNYYYTFLWPSYIFITNPTSDILLREVIALAEIIEGEQRKPRTMESMHIE